MLKQEEISRQIFRNAFTRILGQMKDIESYNVSEGEGDLTISIRFRKGSYNYYYRQSGLYSLEELLSNINKEVPTNAQ